MSSACRLVRPPISGAWREGRVEAIDIERQIGRAFDDHGVGLLYDGVNAHPAEIFSMGHGHVRENSNVPGFAEFDNENRANVGNVATALNLQLDGALRWNYL